MCCTFCGVCQIFLEESFRTSFGCKLVDPVEDSRREAKPKVKSGMLFHSNLNSSLEYQTVLGWIEGPLIMLQSVLSVSYLPFIVIPVRNGNTAISQKDFQNLQIFFFLEISLRQWSDEKQNGGLFFSLAVKSRDRFTVDFQSCLPK